MFNNLIESKAQKQKSARYNALSTMLVASLIASAAYATKTVQGQIEKTKQEDVKFVDVKKEEPPPPKEEPPPPPDQPAVAPPPKGFQVPVAPIKIPDVIPDIDLSKKVTDEADFSGKGVQGGVAKGVVGGTGPVNDNQAFFEFQVDKPAQEISGVGTPPRYPEALRSAGIAGEVQAEFVVDTTGRAEMRTFKILKATNDQFASAVRQALPSHKYLPAEAGGRKVRMVVQQGFSFAIQ